MINISLYLLIFTGCSSQYLVFFLCITVFVLTFLLGRLTRQWSIICALEFTAPNLRSLAKMGPLIYTFKNFHVPCEKEFNPRACILLRRKKQRKMGPRGWTSSIITNSILLFHISFSSHRLDKKQNISIVYKYKYKYKIKLWARFEVNTI